MAEDSQLARKRRAHQIGFGLEVHPGISTATRSSTPAHHFRGAPGPAFIHIYSRPLICHTLPDHSGWNLKSRQILPEMLSPLR